MKKRTLNTSYGTVTGIAREDCTEFRSIRFAVAGRYEKPRLFKPEDGLWDATEYRTMMPQPGYKKGDFYQREFWDEPEFCIPEQEGSLYLNVWVPDDGQDKHPVAIWYHGGAFVNGAGNKVEVDGASFARQGIVFVSANYRLGALGYMCLDMLEKKFGFTGNYGVYDQLCAIDWVHNHIGSFGGDPDDICIMGQSAGAMSVQTLVSSPLLPGCVTKAVMQSGGGYDNGMNSNFTLEEQKKVCAELIERCGINSLEQLMDMDAKQLVLLCDRNDRKEEHAPMVFCPVIDGVVLPATYEKCISEGRIADIPYLLGCTKDDIFVKGDVYESSVFRGCENWSVELVRAGLRPAWVYLFEREPLGGDGEGAFHSSDLWYSFDSLDRSWREKTPEDYRLAKQMNRLWASFIKHGDPNIPTEEYWLPYTEDSRLVRIFK